MVTRLGRTRAVSVGNLSVEFADTAPYLFDDVAAATVVSAITHAGGGTLAFAVDSGSDLVVDATDPTRVSSASFSFAEILAYGTDLQLTVFNASLWRVYSPTVTFPTACVSRALELLAASIAPWKKSIPVSNSAASHDLNVYPIEFVSGNNADLVQVGTSGNSPTNGVTTTNAAEFRVVGNQLIGSKIVISAGGAWIPGTYRIQRIGYDGPNASCFLDRSPAPCGATGGAWSITHDAGGQYAISGDNLVTTDDLRPGNGIDVAQVKTVSGATVVNSERLEVRRISTPGRRRLNISESAYQLTSASFHSQSETVWSTSGGDWTDAAATFRGSTAYASNTDLDNDVTKWVTFNVLSLVQEIVAEGELSPLEIFVRSAVPRVFAARNHLTEPSAKIDITYTDASTETLYCTADAVSGVTNDALVLAPFQTTLTVNQSVPQHPMFQFDRPDPAKTVSAATLSLRSVAPQSGGTATINIMRIAYPQATLPAIELGLADGYTADVGIAAHADVIDFFDCSPAVVDDWHVGDVDDTSNTDYTGGDASKLPLEADGKWVYIAGGVLPTKVDNSYTANGYAELHSTSPYAWRFDCPVGVESIPNAHYLFKTTADGDQAGAWVDGNTPAARKTSNITPAFSTSIDSSIVTVTDVGHGASVGHFIKIPTAVSVGGLSLHSSSNQNNEFTRSYQVLSVVDANHYTIQGPGNATAAITDGGSVPSFFVSGAAQTKATVTLANHGMANTNRFTVGVAVTLAGLTWAQSLQTFAGSTAYTVSAVTTNTFDITRSSGTATTSGTVSMNSGLAQIIYLGGTAGNALPAGKFPQIIYCRKMVRLAPNYMGTQVTRRNGGKWGIGPSHVTRQAGNGGNPTDSPTDQAGRKGWSNRNQWKISEDPGDPIYGNLYLGHYSYHATANQTEVMGGVQAALHRNRWHSVEVMLKMNTFYPDNSAPALSDGEMRMWIDGRKVTEETAVKWRNNPPWTEQCDVYADQAIRELWFNTFNGGVYGGSPFPFSYFVKNIVIAKSYIGPPKLV